MPSTTPSDVLTRTVHEHAAVLAGPVEDATDADLVALDDAIGDARVVAVGESTHFVVEFGAVQRRLIRYLAERHGFTVLAHEFGFAEGDTLDRWLQGHGADDELDLHQGPHAGSEATRSRWRWLREHNATGSDPLRFVGLDTPGGGGTLRPVLEPMLEFLQRADPGAVALVRTALSISVRFEALSQAGAAPLWAQLAAADQTALTAALSRLSLRMDALRPLHLAHATQAEVDLARRHLDVARAAEHMIAAIHDLLFTDDPRPYDASIRDRLMADSLLWHLERLGPDDRVVLLAHNLHIQKATIDQDVVPALTMGSYLAESLGEDYRAIALAHTARRAPTITMTTEDPHGFVVGDGPVAEPPPDGLEGVLIAAGLGDTRTVLPLRALPGDARRALRNLGAQGAPVPTDVAVAFDAAVTVPTATTTEHHSLY